MKILAIETSCDETAAAVIEKSGSDIKIFSNVIASQIPIHKKFGGVFPEMASRAHTEKIIPVVKEALKEGRSTKVKDIDLIAVTTGPGLVGSLLIGVNFAKTLAYITGKPIVGINHLLGHIYSNFVRECQMSNSKRQNLPQFPSIILIVSGGHTGLYLMKSHREITILGETLDDAAGEAFDKVAKLLDLSYPGGSAISQVAQKGDPEFFNFPRSMLDRKDYDFSFSGLKTAVLYETKKIGELSQKIKNDIAASFQQAVIDILIAKTLKAADEFQPKSTCLCGGVSANYELREQMAQAVKNLRTVSFHVPPMSLTTDNAAMIGIAAAYQDQSKYTTFDKVNADANAKL